jgi:hypothetical protein
LSGRGRAEAQPARICGPTIATPFGDCQLIITVNDNMLTIDLGNEPALRNSSPNFKRLGEH